MIFLFFLVGFIIGWFALRALINRKMRIMLESIASSPIHEKKPIINLDFFKHNGRIYAHNRDNNEFMGKGNTKQELIDDLQKRFPETSFMANKSNIKEVGFDDTF